MPDSSSPPDLLFLKGWFAAYVRSFFTAEQEKQKNFMLKIRHTARVCWHAQRIASSLGLGGQARRVAGAVALLHDVGRFEQMRRYNTFDDRRSVDHGLLARQILEESRCLDHLPAGQQQTVLQAVEQHNKLRVATGLGEDTARQLRILRDADKLDIFRIMVEECERPPEKRNRVVELGLEQDGGYSPLFVEALLAGQPADSRKAASAYDVRLMRLAWVYDLNHAYSLRHVLEKAYIQRIARHLPVDQIVCQAVSRVEAVLRQRLHAFGQEA